MKQNKNYTKKKRSKTSKFRNRKVTGHIHVANVCAIIIQNVIKNFEEVDLSYAFSMELDSFGCFQKNGHFILTCTIRANICIHHLFTFYKLIQPQWQKNKWKGDEVTIHTENIGLDGLSDQLNSWISSLSEFSMTKVHFL